MRIIGKNDHFLKKAALVVLLAVAISFSPVQTQKADAFWGEVMQQFLKEALEQITDNIQGYIMGSLKQMAAQMINEQVSNLISGTSSQDSKIIGNYKDFLYTEPLEKTKVYMNDYLTQITSGRGSASNYIPVGSEGFGSGMGTGYNAMLRDLALKATSEIEDVKTDYVGDPGQNLFENGKLDNFLKYTDPGKINNPLTFRLNAEREFNERLKIEKDAARLEGEIGDGMRSVKSGETITTPGSIVAATMVNVMDLGNKIIAGATSVNEVITASITQIITQAIMNGIGKAAENVQREGKASNWINPDTNRTMNSETSNWIDPDTGRPFGE